MFTFEKSDKDSVKAVQAFLKGEVKKTFGKYACDNNALVYRTVVTEEVKFYGMTEFNKKIVLKKLIDAANKKLIVLLDCDIEELKKGNAYRIEYKKLASNVIARRLKSGDYVGNSSMLPLIGQRHSFGHVKQNRSETEVQRYLAQFIPMVPFSVFEQSSLDLEHMVIVDRGIEETIERKRDDGYDSKTGKKKVKIENVHFTGSSLFRVQDKHFLFDVDRREIEHKIFNPFLVELPRPSGTIADAYDSLIPEEVRQAQLAGKKVLRQGEWFFIPVSVTKKQLDKNKVFGLKSDASKNHWQRETLKLQAGPNRPNHAQTGFIENEIAYVKGKIEHSGREHADLVLENWYIAVPNTATKSFTITGDID